MNPTRALPLALLFGSMAFSQSSGKQFSSETFRANCPIELKANLNSTGKVVPIVPAKKEGSARNEQRLHVTLENSKSEIVAARVTVHGYPVGGRVDPAVMHFPDPAEITKTIDFNQTVAAGQDASFEVAVPNFSAVTSISLDSVTYSDGSGWHPEKRKYCRAIGLPMNASANALSR